MQTRHDELRDELVAILGASRELTPDTDKQLADAFIHYLEGQEPQANNTAQAEAPHQPHYSLKLSGAVWGAALMFLFLLALLDNPSPDIFVLVSLVLLSVVALLTRGFLYLARSAWQVPRVEVTLAAPTRKVPRHSQD